MREVCIELWRLTWPSLAGTLFVTAAGVFAMTIVGGAGVQELAVVGLALAVIFPISAILENLIRSGTAAFAEMHARGDHDGMRRQLWQSVWIGALAVAGAGAALLSAPLVLPWLGVSPSLAVPVAHYLALAAAGMPALAALYLVIALFSGQGQVKPIMVVSLVGAAVSVPLTWWLVGRGFAAPLGASGLCVATVAIQWASAAGLWWIFARRNPALVKPLLVPLRPERAAILAILAVGAPLALAGLIRLGAEAVLAFLAAGSGDTEMAAFQIANSVSDALVLPMSALAGSFTIMLAQCKAPQQEFRARQVVRAVLLVSVCLILVMAAITGLLGHATVRAYTDDAALASAAYAALITSTAFAMLLAVIMLSNSTLTVMRRTAVTPMAGLIGYWLIAVPVAAWLAHDGSASAAALWACLAAGAAFIAVFQGSRAIASLYQHLPRLPVRQPGVTLESK